MADDYPPVDIPGFEMLDLEVLKEWVVKLEFYNDGELKAGSGFFIHIPDSPYEVILTAGHNLYTEKKAYMTNVTVLLPNPNKSFGQPLRIPISDQQLIKVSAAYLQDPTILEADYGAILLPYTARAPRRGFGFKVTLAFAELRGNACVSGYRAGMPPGHLALSSGSIVHQESTENQLAYEAKTEQGISGSAVWIVYKVSDVDEFAVVAVHNRRPAPGSRASRGSLITPKLLREVFDWVCLDTKRTIRVQNISKQNPLKPHNLGLFMIFAQKPFARLRIGTGTEFDVLPAQVTSTNVQHVLVLEEKWVTFDIENQQVVLADKPREQSLFLKVYMKNPKKNPSIVYIVLGNKYRLRADGSKLKPHDLKDTQASGMEMVDSKDNSPFVHFSFEPHREFTPITTGANVDPEEPERCDRCNQLILQS